MSKNVKYIEQTIQSFLEKPGQKCKYFKTLLLL